MPYHALSYLMPVLQIKARNEMADYVQDLSDRISAWDGLPLTRLGRLLDVATMKMTDDHSSKRTERYIMLFENALVICKWRSAEQVAIKRMCLMDKVGLATGSRVLTLILPLACLQFFLNTMVEDSLAFRMTLADSSRVSYHSLSILVSVCQLMSMAAYSTIC